MARYQRVTLDKLIVDEAYQRHLDERRVEKIAEEFDPALLGTLEVSQRNGKSAIFDGQHRFAALKQLGVKDAPCLVHQNLSVQDEAMLFVKLQTQRKSLRPLDRFRGRLTAGEEAAQRIRDVVENHGYMIAESGHPHCIGAVTALDRVYARGGAALLDATLKYVSIYRDEPKGTDGAIIEGIAIALDKYRDNPRMDGLWEPLSQITAGSILRKAIAILESGGGSASRPIAVSKVVAGLVGIRGPYKKRQRKGGE